MSKTNSTERTRELTEDELTAVSGGIIKDFSFSVVGGYKSSPKDGGTTKQLRPKD